MQKYSMLPPRPTLVRFPLVSCTFPRFLCYLVLPFFHWGARKQNTILHGKWHGTAYHHDAGTDREQWLSPPVYPHATKQFYEMFENDDSQYDGVYAMLASIP